MECNCGYDFRKIMLKRPGKFERFALIDNVQYKRFLRAELKATESGELTDIATAAQYVGSVMRCPECGCMTIYWPGGQSVSHFQEIIPPGESRQIMDPVAFFSEHALLFPEAVEAPHFEKTSFRVRKKIFATMAPEKSEAVLKLTTLDQAVFCDSGGGAICPVKGKWGEQGWTAIALEVADPEVVLDALACAYCTVAPKALANIVRGG